MYWKEEKEKLSSQKKVCISYVLKNSAYELKRGAYAGIFYL